VTSRPDPNKLHDELDALLDGRPVELTDELAPLVEAADALRVELAALQLDPEVADRHLERVLEGSGTVVQLPVRGQPSGWELRRRVVAVALAAALVLAPATMASAAALPGQAMYPFKRAIEQLRIASVQWSPAREAGERTRVVNVRRAELEQLVELKMFTQVWPAVTALANAVAAAEDAVLKAQKEGAAGSEIAALTGKLQSVQMAARRTVGWVRATVVAAQGPDVSDSTRQAIVAAVDQSQVVLDPQPAESATPPPTPPPEPPNNPPDPTPVEPPPAAEPPPQNPPPGPEPSQPPVTTQTTEPPVTTTTAPDPTTSTEPETTPGSMEGGGGQPAPGSRQTDQVTPSTILPSP
jgi:hypothetical protein